MDENKGNGGYSFTYHASEKQKIRREVELIRNQYLEEDGTSDKLERLKALDNKVKKTPIIISWIIGVVGTLVFGGGLSLYMALSHEIAGIITAIPGVVMILLANPCYKALLKKRKEKYSLEVITLSNELLEEI
ncbi:hypothetical protein [Aquibacillus kalidii]|uniref:hypothetical protein n=1 Tax=Aquibacillus kalidii TaxID=2762597 RepID=UPI001646B575|nr:hypothetical protein [Aquibacillus kalidii]